jgi:hypothetical protein
MTLGFGSFTEAHPQGTIDSPPKLPIIGRVENLSGTDLIELFPLRDGVYVENVDFPGTSSFRLHFSVLKVRDPAQSWSVRILNFADNKELWTFSPAASSRDFWSVEIRGPRARVVVTADGSGSEPQIIIDKVVHLQSIVTPQTDLNGSLKPISEAPPSIRRTGRSVARLIIQRDEDFEPQPCTGFLVGHDLLMTNRHCIKSGGEAGRTVVQFDFDRDGIQPAVQVGVKELLLTSCDLDFVLLRLDRGFSCLNTACNSPYERPALALARNDTLAVGQRLVAIQHPNGEAKKVSKDGCTVDQLLMVGSSSTLTDFAHKCDTDWGSSGTPLQLLGQGDVVGTVVGLHHLGVRKDNVSSSDPRQVNRAVRTRLIISYITQTRPALLNELTLH